MQIENPIKIETGCKYPHDGELILVRYSHCYGWHSIVMADKFPECATHWMPQPPEDWTDADDTPSTPSESSITVRDYLAAAALTGLVQKWQPQHAARLAYEHADYALKERGITVRPLATPGGLTCGFSKEDLETVTSEMPIEVTPMDEIDAIAFLLELDYVIDQDGGGEFIVFRTGSWNFYKNGVYAGGKPNDDGSPPVDGAENHSFLVICRKEPINKLDDISEWAFKTAREAAEFYVQKIPEFAYGRWKK